MALSKAAQREAETVQELRNMERSLLSIGSKFRRDSAATIMSGQLSAAALIVGNVANHIQDRTTDYSE
jgi:hypothetical protein